MSPRELHEHFCSFPHTVRRHTCRDDPPPASQGRPVIVRGIRYVSPNQARLRLGVSIVKIHDWLETGEARYA